MLVATPAMFADEDDEDGQVLETLIPGLLKRAGENTVFYEEVRELIDHDDLSPGPRGLRQLGESPAPDLTGVRPGRRRRRLKMAAQGLGELGRLLRFT